MKKKQRVASFKKIQNRGEFIDWVDDLPILLSNNLFQKLLELLKGSHSVLWSTDTGFIFYS